MRLSDSMRSRPASNDMNRDEETRPLMEPAEPKRPAVTYRIHEQLEPDRSDGREKRRSKPMHPLLAALPTKRKVASRQVTNAQACRMFGAYLCFIVAAMCAFVAVSYLFFK